MTAPEDFPPGYFDFLGDEAPAPDLTHADWARRYIEDLGFALVHLEPGQKRPIYKNWPDTLIFADHWEQHPDHGLGILLAKGRRPFCSLDVDDLAGTRLIFDELGIDLESLIATTPAIEGTPGRVRLLFAAPPDDLRTKKLAWPGRDGAEEITIFELRGGSGYQDVLPPSIHPNGQAYRWLPGQAPWELDVPPLPESLAEMWRDWHHWRPDLARLCPWSPTAAPSSAAPPPRAASPTAGDSVVSAFNAAHDIGALLAAHGYVPVTDRRWLAPGSTTGLPGVSVLDNEKVYSHHGADPLADGFAHDAFDCFCRLEHGGDQKAAVRAAARLLGIAKPERPEFSGGEPGQAEGASAPPVDDWSTYFARGDTPALLPVDLSNLGAHRAQPPEFLIEKILPLGACSLLGGHGESGKSYLGLTLAAHVAVGRVWAGLHVRRGRVLLLSMEDDTEKLYFRLESICHEYELDFASIARNLTIIDASNAPPLAVEAYQGGAKVLRLTDTAKDFLGQAKGYDLVLIDNASDAFAGNEIDRSQVRAFLKGLGKVAKENNGAVLLLVHIDKAAARNGAQGQSYSGSTAWHNSARSRLALTVKDGISTLTHEKSNFGPRLEQPIPLTLNSRGVPTPRVPGELQEAQVARTIADDESVLAAIKAAVAAGRTIPTATTGHSTCWHALRAFPELADPLKAPTGKNLVDEAVIRLHRRELIQIQAFRHDSKDRKKWIPVTTP